MKKEDLKLYTVFINTNGYLSIVYNITKTKYHIMNYNGTFYSLTIDENEVKYEKSEKTPREFFNEFPRDMLRFDAKVIFTTVLLNYQKKDKEKTNRKLLLIL